MSQDPRFFFQPTLIPVSLTEKFKSLNEDFPSLPDATKKGIANRLIESFDVKTEAKFNYKFCGEILKYIGECSYLNVEEKNELAKKFILENTDKKTFGDVQAAYLHINTADDASLQYLQEGTSPAYQAIDLYLEKIRENPELNKHICKMFETSCASPANTSNSSQNMMTTSATTTTATNTPANTSNNSQNISTTTSTTTTVTSSTTPSFLAMSAYSTLEINSAFYKNKFENIANNTALNDQSKKQATEILLNSIKEHVQEKKLYLMHEFLRDILEYIGTCGYLNVEEKNELAKKIIVENTNKKTLGPLHAEILQFHIADRPLLRYLQEGKSPAYKSIDEHLDAVKAKTPEEIAAFNKMMADSCAEIAAKLSNSSRKS